MQEKLCVVTGDKLEAAKKSVIKVLKYRISNFVYKVKGKDRGKEAWHYMLIDMDKKEAFLERASTGSMDVAEYGQVIDSGWGHDIPQAVLNSQTKFINTICNDLFVIISNDRNNEIWNYVLIDTHKRDQLVSQSSIEEIEHYGKILHSAWGQDTPEAISDIIVRTYFAINNFSVGLKCTDISIRNLNAAARNGEVHKARDYIEQKSDVNSADKNGWTMLHHAAYCGNLEVINVLFSKNPNIQAQDSICKRKPIHIAARECHTSVIKLFLSKGAHVFDADENGWMPLHYASWKGNLETVKFLLNANADMNAKDIARGKKPIHIAAEKGYTDVVELFYNCGIDINDSDNAGRTSLYYSAWEGHLETAKFLVSKGANIHAETIFGTKAIHVSTSSTQQEMIEFLLNRGSTIEERDKRGDRLLHHAAFDGHLNVVQFLIGRGASPNAENDFGETPLDCAKQEGHIEVAAYLTDRTAKSCQDLGKGSEALQAYQKLFEFLKDKLSLDHPLTLNTINNIALILSEQGNYEEAIKNFEDVLQRREKILGSDHSDTVSTRHGLGRVFDAQLQYNAALQFYEEVLEKRKRILGSDHSETLSVSHDIAFVLFKQCKHDEALKQFTAIFDKRKGMLGIDHPDTLKVFQDIAVVLVNKGEYKKAFQIFEDIFERKKILLGSNHPDTLSASHHIEAVSRRLAAQKTSQVQVCSIQ